MSRGTSRWFYSKSVRSEWMCIVERHLWVPYSSLLLEAGEGAASRTSLATASWRGNVLCREEKTCFSCQKGSVAFPLLLLLCSAPCMYLSRSALAGGFWDCQASSSPAQHLLGCLLEHILSAYLLKEKKFFWEWSPHLGRAV